MARPLRVDDKGNVRIPAQVRKDLGWDQSTRLVVIPRGGGAVMLAPEVDIRRLRGIAPGADTSGYRDRAGE